MRHAAAEPEAALLVEIADIAHAMPESRRRRRSCASALASLRVTYSRVTTGRGRSTRRSRRAASLGRVGQWSRSARRRCESPSTRCPETAGPRTSRRPGPSDAGFRSALRWPRSTRPAATRWRRRACARRRRRQCSAFIRSSTCGGTGAPAESTRRSVGSVDVVLLAVLADAIPNRRRAKRLRHVPVAGPPRRCSADRRAPGRVGSMSGITVVTPIAQLNRPNSGKPGRSISPGWMP